MSSAAFGLCSILFDISSCVWNHFFSGRRKKSYDCKDHRNLKRTDACRLDHYNHCGNQGVKSWITVCYGKDENEAVKERYYLTMDRISQITRESTVEEPYRSYFIKTAEFIQMISEVKSLVDADAWNSQSLEELKLWNERLYEDVLPPHYETSYANPSYAVRQLGVEFGPKLSFLYEEIRGQIPFAMEEPSERDDRFWTSYLLRSITV